VYFVACGVKNGDVGDDDDDDDDDDVCTVQVDKQLRQVWRHYQQLYQVACNQLCLIVLTSSRSSNTRRR